MRRRLSRHGRVLIGLSVLVIFGLIASGYVIRTSRIDLSTGGVADWPYYGRDQEGTRYAPLDQINRANVGYLEKTWEYHTGDFSDGSDGRPKTTFQATPILVDGVLYLATVYGRVIALNPETGAEIWSYDPEVDPTVDRGEFANRGVTYWQAVDGCPGARVRPSNICRHCRCSAGCSGRRTGRPVSRLRAGGAGGSVPGS